MKFKDREPHQPHALLPSYINTVRMMIQLAIKAMPYAHPEALEGSGMILLKRKVQGETPIAIPDDVERQPPYPWASASCSTSSTSIRFDP